MTNQSTFHNDNINVTLDRQPGCKIRMEVTVTPKATQASRHKAMENVRKEVSIPGFRKGKAPEAMITQNYDKHIESEWKDILLNTTLEEALRLSNVYPFNKNSVKSASIKSVSPEKGAVLSYEYESGPTVPKVDASQLSIKNIPLKTVTEKDVEKTLHDLRQQSGEWKDVTDRPVKEGDFVVIDIDDIGESGHNICRETLFEVAEGKMAPWMKRLITGMKLGDMVEGVTEQDEHTKKGHDEDCKECHDGTHTHGDHFVPTKCRIMLHTIRNVHLHPLDDALAKKYGAENAETLKERVKASLEKRALDEQKDAQRQLMEKELLEKFPFEIPASLVQAEVKAAKEAYISSLKKDGQPADKVSKEAKEFEAMVAKKYDRDIHLYFITQMIAKENNLRVDQNEVMDEFMRQVWMSQSGQSTIDLSMDPKDVQGQLHMRLMAAKALDFLTEKAAAH